MIVNKKTAAIIAGEHTVSYPELNQRINLFASVTPNQEDCKTIIFSENREGWIYAFFAVWRNQGIAVPVDASATVDDLAYIINDCQPSCIWVSKNNKDTTLKAMQKLGKELQVLLIDDYEKASADTMADNDPTPSFEETDSKKIAVIIYTSGTTGSPKGVMLTYGNLLANVYGVVKEVPIFNEDRRTMVLLPVHHILPLMGTVIIPIVFGGGVAICPSLSGPDIMDTLCRGKVAIFIGVPRLWQTLYSGIKKKIDSSAVTRTLFKICGKVNNRSLSRFVFQSVRKKMGGNIQYCVSGGAALDKEIGNGLRTLGLDVLEGYGMTETAPIICFTRPDDIIPGCVGLPLPSVKCKVVNGELLAKGNNVMLGYYNRPEETAAVLDADGYIHTGDLATIDEKGRVYITGRTKEIIVLSNGKNVQPAEIEYKLEKYATQVKEVAVTQDGDMLCAIIVPQPQWANGKTDAVIEQELKREVIEPYNRSTTNYKKIMNIFVYHNDLPRTKLDKLQRFKLKDIIAGKADKPTAKNDATDAEMSKELVILKNYIEQEKKITVRPTDHIETDLAFDSLDMVGLQGFIEQTFGMQLNADSMVTFRDIQAIADFIAKQKTRSEVENIDWNILLNSDTTKLQLPETSALLTTGAKFFKGSFKMYNRLTVIGKENIPAKGPFIIAPNHQSVLDGPLATTGMTSSQIKECYFYATEEHVQNSTLKYLARNNNIILMERKSLKDSIMKLAQVLKMGKNIIIFPEGSRTHTGEVGTFKKTFAILSKELNVPILPVVISGAYEALPRGSRIGNMHKITVEYLPVITPTASESYEDIAAEVRSRIREKVKH